MPKTGVLSVNQGVEDKHIVFRAVTTDALLINYVLEAVNSSQGVAERKIGVIR